MLQSINTSIDTVQGVKTAFVNTFVTNETFKKPLQTYIDSQTAFAKSIAKSTNDFFTTVGQSVAAFDVKKAFATK